MAQGLCTLACIAVLALAEPAEAATFVAKILDQDGEPVANAVIALVPDSGSMPPSRLPAEKTIDQRNETFIPLVTIIPKGGRIVFANNDSTTHQVYSFSAIKQFEITLGRGEKSPPFVFDTPGIAALGCNIHDHMIAYAYVAQSPWTAISDSDGRAAISNVPAGGYQAQLWHPQLPPARQSPNLHVAVSGERTEVSFKANLLTPPGARMAHSHAGRY